MYVNYSYYCSQAFVLGFNAKLIRESEVCKTMMKDNTFGKKRGGTELHKVAAVCGGWMQVRRDRLPGRCSVLGGHTDSSPLTDDHSGWSFQQSFLFQSGLDDTFLEGGDRDCLL